MHHTISSGWYYPHLPHLNMISPTLYLLAFQKGVPFGQWYLVGRSFRWDTSKFWCAFLFRKVATHGWGHVTDAMCFVYRSATGIFPDQQSSPIGNKRAGATGTRDSCVRATRGNLETRWAALVVFSVIIWSPCHCDIKTMTDGCVVDRGIPGYHGLATHICMLYSLCSWSTGTIYAAKHYPTYVWRFSCFYQYKTDTIATWIE